MDALTYALRLDNADFTGRLSAAMSNLGRFGGVAEQAGRQADRAWSGAAEALGKVAIAATAFSVLSAGVKRAMDYESTIAQLKVLTGSQEAANRSIREWSDFAATTPLREEEINKAGRALLAFGVGQKDVTSTMRMLGDISSGVGMRMDDLASIYGKARVQGRLFAEDINQLTGRGIPIITELGKVMQVSTEEVKALVESGKIGFPELEKAMQSMTSAGGKFSGMMKEMGETTAGQLSTLRDSWDNLVRDMAVQALPTIKLTVEAAGNGLPYLAGAANTITGGVAGWGSFFGNLAAGHGLSESWTSSSYVAEGRDLPKEWLEASNKDFEERQKTMAAKIDAIRPNGLAIPGNAAAVEKAMKEAERRAKIDKIVAPALKAQEERAASDAALQSSIAALFVAPKGMSGLAIAGGALPEGFASRSPEAFRAKVDAVFARSLEKDLLTSGKIGNELSNGMDKVNKQAAEFEGRMEHVLTISRNLGRSDKQQIAERAAALVKDGMSPEDAKKIANAEGAVDAADKQAGASQRSRVAMERENRRLARLGKKLSRADEFFERPGKDGESVPLGLGPDVLDMAKTIRHGIHGDIAGRIDRAGQQGGGKAVGRPENTSPVVDPLKDLLNEVKALRKGFDRLAAV